MLTLEKACTALGVSLGDVLSHRIYPDRVVVVVRDGRKLTYWPEPEATEVVTTPEPEPERAPAAKPRKGRAISADIPEREADNA